MRAALLICAGVVAQAGWAQQPGPQEDEFQLPQFTPPAEQPTAPVPGTPPPPGLEAPRPQTRVVPSRLPADPSWARLGVAAHLLFTALTTYYLGGDLALFVHLLGEPVSSETVPGEVEGWVLQVGALGQYGRAGGAVCEGAAFCASRAGGGVSTRVGWARGLPHVGDGVTRLQTFYFGQLDVLLTHYNIPSAPLAPGVRTFELLTRGRFGLHFTSEPSRVTATGITLMAAVVIEGVVYSRGTQGIAFGLCVGAGF